MILVTSISPKHSNSMNQHKAIESWQKYGGCFSLNNPSEIEKIKSENYKGIEIIPTHKTIEHYVGKPLVTINSIIDFALLKEQSLMIVNSDIILKDLPALKEDGITLFSRFDYEGEDMSNTIIFPHGWDAFYIPYKFLKIFPPSVFALGATHWDHWLPKICMQNSIKLFYSITKHAFHKLHPVQYPLDEWYLMGNYYRLSFKLGEMPIGDIAKFTVEEINKYLIRIQ